MKYLPSIPYPENEKPKLAALESLFREWHHHFASPSSGLEKEVADGMVFDGFYPYYFAQKRKVLFIGREARDIAYCNYIEMMYCAYRVGKRISSKSLDNSLFHRRMLWIAYGILNGMTAWENIPEATKIGDTFGDSNGLSFAFMNISKLSNQGENSETADRRAIEAAYALSIQRRNFIQEEVAILEPDIIITMSLVDFLKNQDELESLGDWTPAIHATPQAKAYWLEIQGRQSLVIDTFHFSARRKDDDLDFYAPICDSIRRSEATSGAGGGL